MAIILLLLAIALGVGFGVSLGGSLHTAALWQPVRWQIGAAGFAVMAFQALFGFSGAIGFILSLVSFIAVGAFAFLNLRTGGMILILIGCVLNLAPLLINGETPVSLSALESSGLIEDAETASSEELDLNGPRHVATDDDALRKLGEIIPLPTRQVISVGDVLMLFGYSLSIISILRGRVVRY